MRAVVHDDERFDDEDNTPPLQKPAALPFLWHDASLDPLPEGVPVLASEADGSPCIVRLDESGYLFDYSSGENLDPADILFWGYIPAAPNTEEDGE